MRAISYSMSYYILADNPGMAAMEVLDESKRMMEGYKMKYFRLMLRFLVYRCCASLHWELAICGWPHTYK